MPIIKQSQILIAMIRLLGPYIISLIWLAPFFPLAFFSGRIYRSGRQRVRDNLAFLLNNINIALIILIAVRDITLTVFRRGEDISIFETPIPFFGFLVLFVVTYWWEPLYARLAETRQEMGTRRFGLIALILLLSIMITAVFMEGIRKPGSALNLIFSQLEEFLPRESVTASASNKQQRAAELFRKKIKKYGVPPELYPPKIPGFIANPVQRVGINGITVWYQPDDPNIVQRTKGITVFITKQRSAEKAAQFLWPSRRNAYPFSGGDIVLNGQTMYQGFNQGDNVNQTRHNRPYQTYLIAWTKGKYTFEIYASLEENAEIDGDLLITLARLVAEVINKQAQAYNTAI